MIDEGRMLIETVFLVTFGERKINKIGVNGIFIFIGRGEISIRVKPFESMQK